MGNAGTAMRLFMGLLAGQRFDSTLIGDASLIASADGARRAAAASAWARASRPSEGRPPVQDPRRRAAARHRLRDADGERAGEIRAAAGGAVRRTGRTRVTEPAPTRDHTERMLRGFGVESSARHSMSAPAARVSLTGGAAAAGPGVTVPGDFSSAAFFIVAGCLGGARRR